MYYTEHMDTTIRNLDERAYRELNAHAALTGRTIGETLNDAIRAYLARSEGMRRDRSLAKLEPRPYPPGNERLRESIGHGRFLEASWTPRSSQRRGGTIPSGWRRSTGGSTESTG